MFRAAIQTPLQDISFSQPYISSTLIAAGADYDGEDVGWNAVISFQLDLKITDTFIGKLCVNQREIPNEDLLSCSV